VRHVSLASTADTLMLRSALTAQDHQPCDSAAGFVWPYDTVLPSPKNCRAKLEQAEFVYLEAAEFVVVDLYAAKAASFGQHSGLGLDDLGHVYAAHGAE
jgi:hypothetical protein